MSGSKSAPLSELPRDFGEAIDVNAGSCRPAPPGVERGSRRAGRLDVVLLPDYSQPMVRVRDYLHLVERSTYSDDRVRP